MNPNLDPLARLRAWESLGCHRWGLGVAVDLCDLEARLDALERTIHDAAPAAIASAERGRTDKADFRHGEGTGDTQEPVAWAVILAGGHTYERCDYRWEAEAIAAALPAAEGVTATVAPLYRSPTLTDAEREAVEMFAALAWTAVPFSNVERQAATLRGLLERTK